MKVHLVDGTYELFRSYFALPPIQAPDGRPVGAVRGIGGEEAISARCCHSGGYAVGYGSFPR